MTLSKWIEDYCEENSIELPEDIPDEETALMFINTVANGSGGGGDLPEVTSADEGKVLAVNASGEWAAEQFAGYDLVLQVNCDDEGNTINITSVKGTIEDIIQKILDGKHIITYVYSLYKSNDGNNIVYSDGPSTIEYYVEDGEVSGVTVKYIISLTTKFVSPNYLVSGVVKYIVYDGEGWIED